MAFQVNNLALGTDPRYLVFGTTNLGATSGPIELKKSAKIKDIKCDQYGDEVIDQIFQGEDMEIIATLKEVDAKMLRLLWAGINAIDPTIEAAKKDGIGFGTSQAGTLMSTLAKQLTCLKLSAATGDVDKADQIVFYKAYPITEGLKFSGNDDKEIQVTFKILADPTKDAKESKGFWHLAAAV